MNAPSSPEAVRPLLRVAVLASGRGSNLQALHRAQTEGRLPIALTGVFSDKPGSGAVASVTSRGSTNCTRMPLVAALCFTGAVMAIFIGSAVWVTGAVICSFRSPLFLPKM